MIHIDWRARAFFVGDPVELAGDAGDVSEIDPASRGGLICLMLVARRWLEYPSMRSQR
jgi:hypothetical protein